MEKDKNLKKLFQDSLEKPKNLDHNIMRKIRLEALSSKEIRREETKSRNWIYLILGLFSLIGVLVSLPVLIKSFNLTVWLMVLALAIPLTIDGLLRIRKSAI